MMVSRIREIGNGLYASPLPLAREIRDAASRLGIRTVIDLTQRPRGTVRRACKAAGLKYIKRPTAYDDRVDASFALGFDRPILVHCFHGRDRTGGFVESWLALHP